MSGSSYRPVHCVFKRKKYCYCDAAVKSLDHFEFLLRLPVHTEVGLKPDKVMTGSFMVLILMCTRKNAHEKMHTAAAHKPISAGVGISED